MLQCMEHFARTINDISSSYKNKVEGEAVYSRPLDAYIIYHSKIIITTRVGV